MSGVALCREIVATVVQNRLRPAQCWGVSQSAWRGYWGSSANAVYFSNEAVRALTLLLMQQASSSSA